MRKKKLNRFVGNESPIVLAIFFAGAIFPFLSNDFYLIELVKIAAIFSIFAMSWDVFSGYTHEVNFGFAFFVGGSGYLSAILNSFFCITPYATVPIAALATGVLGIFIGYLTLRLKGPYFAMVTMVFAAILFTMNYIFTEITGGEEGISGISSFKSNPIHDFFIVWACTATIYFVVRAYGHSKHGTILKAIRANEDATKSAGINTSYYKIEAFAISGFFGGIGGGLFAHSQMNMGPSMLSGSLSILIVLLATVGGMGTIVGPFLAAICLSFLNEYLRIIAEYRLVIYTGLLILLIYLAPDGLINVRFVKGSKKISFIFFGDRRP